MEPIERAHSIFRRQAAQIEISRPHPFVLACCAGGNAPTKRERTIPPPRAGPVAARALVQRNFRHIARERRVAHRTLRIDFCVHYIGVCIDVRIARIRTCIHTCIPTCIHSRARAARTTKDHQSKHPLQRARCMPLRFPRSSARRLPRGYHRGAYFLGVFFSGVLKRYT